MNEGNNESAGKTKSSRTNKGNKGLKAVLCQAAWAASKTKTSQIAPPWDYLPKKEKRLDYRISKIKSMGYTTHLQDNQPALLLKIVKDFF
ncbi:transposase [Paenibacillus thermotolerans]|uniref:transposase n=1 Tax=Paenibacillus thermotolerans TaxID=3027807 RepID=UPI003CC5BDF9